MSREVEIHRRLTDRHIIQFYDSEYVSEGQERRLRLVMEYAEGEGLDEAIKAGKLLWCDKERIAGEIAHGLSYLHSQGIIHCDIKSKNILLTKKLEVKICDFGSAMTTQDKKDRKKCSLGTKEWMAPEFSRDHTAYSPASDIYALGVIMWEMASSKEANDAIKVQEEKPEDVPHEYLRIMQACCDEDPNNRPGAREIAFLKLGRSLREQQEETNRIFKGHASLKDKNLHMLSQFVSGINLDADRDAYASENLPSDDSSSLDIRELFASEMEDSDKNVRMALQHYSLEQYDQALDCARQAGYHPMACYLLFQMYSKGEGVEMNQGEAFRWDFRAAEAGLAISQSHVGNHFYKVRNYPRALSWFRRAAEQGDRDAECNLGIMHFYGHGVLANPEEGEKWILKAVDRGDITAASMMGIICAHQERYSEAMEYCRKAVDDRIAEYHIGCFYRYGLGILPDYSAAMEWFERSAQKEHSLAEFAIAQMFYEGHGVKRDLEKVKEWFSRAHQHGHPDAAVELAVTLSEMDKGELADDYLFLAAKKDHPLAEANRIMFSDFD